MRRCISYARSVCASNVCFRCPKFEVTATAGWWTGAPLTVRTDACELRTWTTRSLTLTHLGEAGTQLQKRSYYAIHSLCIGHNSAARRVCAFFCRRAAAYPLLRAQFRGDPRRHNGAAAAAAVDIPCKYYIMSRAIRALASPRRPLHLQHSGLLSPRCDRRVHQLSSQHGRYGISRRDAILSDQRNAIHKRHILRHHCSRRDQSMLRKLSTLPHARLVVTPHCFVSGAPAPYALMSGHVCVCCPYLGRRWRQRLHVQFLSE
jgi:hypothetical protein